MMLGESFSEETLQAVLREVDLEEYLSSLPQGLHTSVGEGGRVLSGGQRQRVALARSLLRGRKIILLDEGTSSLDEKSALAIEKNLVNNPHLIVIMVSHHLRESIKQKLDGGILQ